MFALDDLARLFNLTVREDAAAGGLTITAGAQTIVLSPQQPLASVAGRMISLPAAPVRDGRTWYVPVDFVSRALASILAGAPRAAQAVAPDHRRRRPPAAHRGAHVEPLGSRDAGHARRRAADAAHRHAGSDAAPRPLRRRRARRGAAVRVTPTDTVPGVHVGETPPVARDRSRPALRLVPGGGSARRHAGVGAHRRRPDRQTETPPRRAPRAARRRRRSAAACRPETAAAARPAAGRRPPRDRHRRRARRRRDRRERRAGDAREERHAERRAAAEGGARGAARRPRAAHARRRSDRAARSARGARQQQQGGSVHQPARQRVAAAGRQRAPRSST